MKAVILFVIIFVAKMMVNADDPGCNVVPMTQWAGEPTLRKQPLSTPLGLVIMQHTVSPEATTDEECQHVLNAIRKYQREAGFDDIGESFLVCGNGKVYEGAGWGLVGAHTKSYNAKSIGISFIGEFGSHLPNSEALNAAKDLIACGVTNKHLVNDYKMVGHRQVTKTVSPGDALQKELENWPNWTNNP